MTISTPVAETTYHIYAGGNLDVDASQGIYGSDGFGVSTNDTIKGDIPFGLALKSGR